MEEIEASISFMDYFENFSESTSYNFSMTDLHTKISELTTGHNKLLVFYLHHSANEFSWNFCNFLQDPVIEQAFHNHNLILYCWNIERTDLQPILIQSLRKEIGDNYTHYIIRNKSVVFTIKAANNAPVVVDVYEDAIDLFRLYNIIAEQVPTVPINEVIRQSVQESVTGESHTDNINNETITPLSFQQFFVNNLGDRDYDSFESNEHELLKNKIGFAFYGPPTETVEINPRQGNDNSGEIGTADNPLQRVEYKVEQQKYINKLFERILKENNAVCKWNGRIVISFVYVCAEALPKVKVAKAKKFEKRNEEYDPDADFIPYPVFILRKCKCRSDPSKACRIIIDHEARVYPSWVNYLENNRLHRCKLVYPKDGRYRSEGTVTFETNPSPACTLRRRVTEASDTTASVTGLLTGGVSAAAAIPVVAGAIPFIAAAAPAALAVGLGAGIYTAGRSIYNLVDRRNHRQEIDLSNSESRAAYLNIAGGAVGVGLFGATRVVSSLAQRGAQLGQRTTYLLYGLSGVGLSVNGIGILNNVYEAYQTGNTSPLLIAQIGASVFFFGNSLYNFTSIGRIVEESQVRALAEIEGSLRSNRHRRTFNKLLKESIRTQGEVQGKASVISSIRNVQDVNEVMATLTRSNRMLNNQGIRFSAQDGQIHLNGVAVDMTNFGSMNRANQTVFLDKFPPIPKNLTPNVRYAIIQDVRVWLCTIDILSRCSTNIAQLVDEIFSAFTPFVRDFIMDILKQFLNQLDPAIVTGIATIVTERLLLNIITKWVVNQLQGTQIFQQVLNYETVPPPRDVATLIDDLLREFRYYYVNYEYDFAEAQQRRNRRRIGNVPKDKKHCVCCSGYYYL